MSVALACLTSERERAPWYLAIQFQPDKREAADLRLLEYASARKASSAFQLVVTFGGIDTPVGINPRGFSRPAGEGFQGGADTSPTGSALRDGPARPKPL